MRVTILAGIAALFLATGTANAANMRIQRSVVKAPSGKWVDSSSNLLLIFIEGDIVSGDYVKFKKMADRLPYGTIVVMTSRGGIRWFGHQELLHHRAPHNTMV
jgi:hypothetical protein